MYTGLTHVRLHSRFGGEILGNGVRYLFLYGAVVNGLSFGLEARMPLMLP